MKKIVASVGLVVALGVSGVQAASVAGLSSETVKPWNISVALRGFYDDNVNSVPDKFADDSFGFQVRPSLGFQWSSDLTSVKLGYTYNFTYYEDKPTGNADNYDQNHNFDVALSHSFSPQVQLSLADSFVIGQEPDTLRADPTFNTFQRISGDNIRNYGFVNLDVQLTRLFSFQVGYANSFFDYDDDKTVDQFGNPRVSNSGLLDRIEHMPHVDLRWQLAPQTVGLLGYKFREINYTGDQLIDLAGTATSDTRDSRAHYVYAGVEHTFRPDLTGTLRAGASFIDYYNDPNNESDTAPYVVASLKYMYMPESSVEVGFSYDRNATDQFSVSGNGSVTQDAQSATLWANVSHHFTPRITGNLVGQIQNSTYNGGSIDGDADLFFIAGLNVEYRINQYLSATAGYNFDKLDSDQPNRSFDRNRVYLGVTASY
jgi:hypothetical protein